MKFDIGDKVEVLDDLIVGVITAIEANEVVLETEDGFSLKFPIEQIVNVADEIKVTNHEAASAKMQKETPQKRTLKAPKAKERNAPKMEVDLHIHHLVKSTRGMSNFDILEIQLQTAKRQLEFAIKKRIQKVVFIHGVGEGVLKEELKYLFNKYENVKFYDAEYRKYGLGATEVYIFQNI